MVECFELHHPGDHLSLNISAETCVSCSISVAHLHSSIEILGMLMVGLFQFLTMLSTLHWAQNLMESLIKLGGFLNQES